MATFTKTVSINSFADANGIEELVILKNPKTGSNFLVDDKGNTYRMGKDITELSTDLMMSWFTPEDGDASYMLHKKGAGAEVVSKLAFGKKAVLDPF